MAKSRITSRKYLGDDAYSHAVFIDGRPFVTGLTRREVPYYRKKAQESLDARPNIIEVKPKPKPKRNVPDQPSLREQEYAEEVAAGQHDGFDS